MGKLRASLLATAVLCVGVAAAPAEGAFPGKNGKIAYEAYEPGEGSPSMHTINPDGTGVTRLPGFHGDPLAWSPSGTQIAFDCGGMVCKVDADGSNWEFWHDNGMPFLALDWAPDATRLALIALSEDWDHPYLYWVFTGEDPVGSGLRADVAGDAAWSPDGSRIAFRDGWPALAGGIQTIAADGSGLATVPNTDAIAGSVRGIDWSPDAERLAFAGSQDDVQGLFTIKLDGSGLTRITSAPSGSSDVSPAWSPDGSKVAFNRGTHPNTRLLVVDATGGTPTELTAAGAPIFTVDWQPIPVNAYPRPKAASPVQVSLVPAYEPCTAPNRTHGPPLAFGSCSGPQQSSSLLTIGTPDANGLTANAASYIRVGVRAGIPSTPEDEADVHLRGRITDVRNASDLSDYTGDLTVRLTAQITDKDNTPHPGGPGAATVRELTHLHPVSCAATAGAAVGATCQFQTTVEALVPGALTERKRAIWQLGQIEIEDANGDAFLRQGVFVP